MSESHKKQKMKDGRGHPHHHPRGIRASIINWRESELPFFQKLRVAAANEWLKLRRGQPCCGHPGEPGC